MTREILFRGLHSGGWVFGTYHYSANGFFHYILAMEKLLQQGEYLALYDKEVFEVNPESIGQFTGLRDKNGKKIFEGDIVHSKNWEPSKMVVKFDRGAFYLADIETKQELADIKYVENMIFIGNIHQNTELL